MNYIFITRDGMCLPIADRLKDEGGEVLAGIVHKEESSDIPKEKTEARLSLYRGIMDVQSAEDVMVKIKDIKDKDNWFFMCDYGDLWPYSEKALAMGFRKGIFPTEKGYALENERKRGKDFAKKNYPLLKVAEAKEFHKVKDAIKYLEEQEDSVFVVKSEGSYAETVVPETDDPELAKLQIIGALTSEAKGYEQGGFTLEKKIDNAIELSPVMVFWNGKPLFSLMELENKPLGAGNIGRLSGGAQNLTIRTRLDAPINEMAFPPIIHEMARKQTGIAVFDAGILFDGNDFYFTEFCSQRWGWDGIFSEIQMSADKKQERAASRHFEMITAGQNPIGYNYGVAVRLFQTDPDSHRRGVFKDGYTMDWDSDVSDQLWFYCIRKEKQDEDQKEDRFVSVGYAKDMGVATGSADDPQQAIEMAYAAVGKLAMTGLFYRPKFDFVSRDYFASIMNRLDFLQSSELL